MSRDDARPPPPPPPANTLVSTALASALSGALSRIPCHPLDTIKSVVQAHRGAAGSAPGPLAAARSLLARGGLRALYRGVVVTTLGSAPATCLYLTAYEASKGALAPAGAALGEPAVHLAAGCAAEALSCLAWVPLDVLKERMQVQAGAGGGGAGGGGGGSRAAGHYYRSARDGAAHVLRTEGVAGLYRGYGATLASFAPFSAIYFALYERAKTALARRDGAPPVMSWQVAAAAAAGCVASFVTNPLELAKLRLQVQRADGGGGGGGGARPPTFYRGTLHAIGTIVREEGALALFRGAGARMAYHAPVTAITMTLFEQFRAALTARGV